MKIGVWNPPVSEPVDWGAALRGLQMAYPNGYEPADWTGIGAVTHTDTANLCGGTTTEYEGDHSAIKNVAFP